MTIIKSRIVGLWMTRISKTGPVYASIMIIIIIIETDETFEFNFGNNAKLTWIG